MNLVCLVSRQAMANVLPVFMYQPQNVFLLSTPEEINCARHLQSLFMKKGIKVFLYDDISAYDDIDLNTKLELIFSSFEKDIFLNVTGGTKPMALAAYEYFRKNNKPVFYCNTEHLGIIHLLPLRKIENLKTNITIENYLAAYGYKIEEEKSARLDFAYETLFAEIEKDQLLDEFIKFTDSVRKALDKESYQTVNSIKKNFSFQKTPANFVLALPNVKPPLKYKFGAKEFLFGDWLEYYVYWKFKSLNPDEMKIGVKIVSDNQIRNEIDLIILKNYKLYLISCKSGKAENAALYELETLRAITSGTFGKGVAVLSSTPSENIIQRAKELSITLVLNVNKITDTIFLS
jgi:hypothetical protein